MRSPNRTLVRALAELLNALNAAWPLGRKGYSTVPTFAFGWPTTELAPYYLTASSLDAARRGIRGDFAGRRGLLALLLHIVGWGLLVLVARRNVTSRRYFQDGLRATLGPALPAGRIGRRAGALATGWSRRRYADPAGTVCYGPHGRANLADIWRRPDLPRDGKAPVLLQVPGGAWMIGMRRPQAYPLMSQLAEHGWVCVSIGYRISPRHTWPDHIVDVKRALAWVKENIADYGGDPDCIVISGGSAGGHLSALAALTPGDPAFQPGFEDADTSVVAAVPVYGRYDWFSTSGLRRREFVEVLQRFIVKTPHATDGRRYRDASPIHRVRPDAPPFFVLHGTDDSLIPVGEAREFVAALRATSQNVVAYAEIPHAQHAFDMFGSPRGRYTAEAVEQFLSWVLTRRQRD